MIWIIAVAAILLTVFEIILFAVLYDKLECISDYMEEILDEIHRVKRGIDEF